MEKLFAMKQNKKNCVFLGQVVNEKIFDFFGKKVKGFCHLPFYLLTLLPFSAFAETNSPNSSPRFANVRFSGYITGIHNSIYVFQMRDYNHLQMLHNRLNFQYSPNENWRFVSEIRTRGMYYSLASSIPGYADQIRHYNGLTNLSWNWINSGNTIFNTTIDRLFLSYEIDQLVIRVGRQRINWSQTLVFNPNDIFNTYSFFDFDYQERQGCDAVRIQYYPSPTSVVELAVSVNAERQSTLAAMYRFNYNSIDFQVMTGWYKETDFVIGGGIVSDINGLNIRSEFAYFTPFSSNSTSMSKVNISLGLDYIFSNSMMLSGEVLYSSRTSEQGDFSTLLTSTMSAKNLSMTTWTAVAQISYPFSPIFSGNLAMMSFVNLPAFYVGPSISANPFPNFTLTATTQLFLGDRKVMQPNQIGLFFVGLRWDF